MKRVIIADDDFFVRKYLSQLIDWEANGYQLSAVAKDGSQAMEMIREHGAQILLTDIEMPVMNGIELLRKAKAENKDLKVVILSCHDDFAYVREAMRIGADEYLLKDEVTAESLLKVLQQQLPADAGSDRKDTSQPPYAGQEAADVQQKNSVPEEISGIPDEAEIQKTEMENRILLQLLEGKIDRTEIISPDAVMAIRLTDYEEKSAYETMEKREAFYKTFSRTCRKNTKGFADCKCIHVRGGWFALLCAYPKAISRQDQQFMLRENAGIIQKEADRHFEVSVQIGISEAYVYKNDTAACWDRARELLGFAFYEKSSIFYGWQYGVPGTCMPACADQFLDQAVIWKAKRDKDSLMKACQQVLEIFQTEKTQEKLVFEWMRNADRVLGIEARPLPKHFSLLQEIAREYGKACEEKLQEIQQYSDSVAAVIRYVQQNYRHDISLNSAANVVHLTPTYLSYTFHKETDITFSEYLQSCRINHAKELLENTDEKVREIGFMVGYNDNRHFGKIFKKATGFTPQEYRKKYR